MGAMRIAMRRLLLPLFFLTMLLPLAAGCGGAPQLNGDPQCYKHVDALLTAISSHNPVLVEQCAQELGALHQAGTLPDAAHAYLEQAIDKARKSDWKAAREDVVRLVKGQRRAV
jgi:hypothetical protein